LADIYRTFVGFVAFNPDDGEAAGKDIRSFRFRTVGVRDQAIDVRATLWPSHADVELEKGDAVLVEGKFTVNKAKDKNGDPQTYFNLSVSSILVLGKGERGERVETANASTGSDEVALQLGDDIPY
jgi:hypothetical protein